MKTGKCSCGAKVFFDNSQCIACGTLLGHCDRCDEIAAFTPTAIAQQFACSSCGTTTKSCRNRRFGVCNSQVPIDHGKSLCDWCEFTEVVPSLDDHSNVQKWKELEKSKRQLLSQLWTFRLPPHPNFDGDEKPLRFRFLADSVDENGNVVRTVTGHADGIITININEADSVYREKQRIKLREPQRTLIGHLRHEYGHYLDWCIPQSKRSSYIDLFGDPQAIPYSDAMERYYAGQRLHNWRASYVSEYASMHPWEDFAESVNLYLDILAVAQTAKQSSLPREMTIDVATDDMTKIVVKTLKVAVLVTEINSDMGLPPLLPENIPEAVLRKLGYVHSLRG